MTTNLNVKKPKLAIVIHAEEEFDWDKGFYRSNNSVNHGEDLIQLLKKIRETDAKIVLAMDYAFIESSDGKKVIDYCQSIPGDNIEFASHLHPWVTPPFVGDEDRCENFNSYPGNLSYNIEKEKIEVLSKKIEEYTGYKPKTYLAGRYGIGSNTHKIIRELGYTSDISISPFFDYTFQQGPNFDDFKNQVFHKAGLLHWPHTVGITTLFPPLSKFINLNPEKYKKINIKIIKLILKFFRVQRIRLSPEGFSLANMKKLTQVLCNSGQNNLILSFHSPSVRSNCTPYVKTESDREQFDQKIINYLIWFKDEMDGETILVKDLQPR